MVDESEFTPFFCREARTQQLGRSTHRQPRKFLQRTLFDKEVRSNWGRFLRTLKRWKWKTENKTILEIPWKLKQPRWGKHTWVNKENAKEIEGLKNIPRKHPLKKLTFYPYLHTFLKRVLIYAFLSQKFSSSNLRSLLTNFMAEKLF